MFPSAKIHACRTFCKRTHRRWSTKTGSRWWCTTEAGVADSGGRPEQRCAGRDNVLRIGQKHGIYLFRGIRQTGLRAGGGRRRLRGRQRLPVDIRLLPEHARPGLPFLSKTSIFAGKFAGNNINALIYNVEYSPICSTFLG